MIGDQWTHLAKVGLVLKTADKKPLAKSDAGLRKAT